MKHYDKYYDLLPCPFCGGEAKLESRQRAFIDGKSTRVALVYCKDCHARAGRYKLSDFGKGSHSTEAEQAAVDHWNMRKPETVTEFADRCRECGREKVLNKIRAEIEQMNNIDYVEPVTVDDVLQIIDKYM